MWQSSPSDQIDARANPVRLHRFAVGTIQRRNGRVRVGACGVLDYVARASGDPAAVTATSGGRMSTLLAKNADMVVTMDGSGANCGMPACSHATA
jgi:hypothetical protein